MVHHILLDGPPVNNKYGKCPSIFPLFSMVLIQKRQTLRHKKPRHGMAGVCSKLQELCAEARRNKRI